MSTQEHVPPVLGLALLALAAVGRAASAGEEAGERGPIARAGRALAERYGAAYEPVDAKAEARFAPSTLPIDAAKLANPEALDSLGLGAEARKTLLERGFVLLLREGRGAEDDVVEHYQRLARLELPLYVTADSVLHLYHVQFDELLRGLEERELADDLERLLAAMRKRFAEAYEVAAEKMAHPVYAAGLRKACAFVATAERLLMDRSGERDRVAEARAKLEALAFSPDWGERARFFSEYGDVRTVLQALNATLPDAERVEADVLDYPGDEGIDALRKLCERYETEAAKRGGGASLKLPGDVEPLVAAEVEQVRARKGPSASAIFTYEEDFSQYIPRGHYTRSEKLKRYFLAMMYLGRLTFLVKGGEPYGPAAPYLVPADEAHAQTVAAALLAGALHECKVAGGGAGGERAAIDVWWRIYGLTGFFVGLADDLTAPEYAGAIRRALEVVEREGRGDTAGRIEAGRLCDDAAYARLKLEVARLRPPSIYSGTGGVTYLDPKALQGSPSPEVVDRALEKTQGFRLMGQRFTPDGYIHGRLVQPTVGRFTSEKDRVRAPFTMAVIQGAPRRAFPRGLDIAATLLGSRRAKAILADLDDSTYEGYAEEAARLEKDVAALTPADWNGNLYYAWLHALRGLVGVEYGKGYPAYMQGDAWATKELATALGSWSQLRHDTILYVKQPYGMAAGSAMRPPKREPTGHVEPVPELYGRLLALARFTRKVIDQEKALDEQARERLAATEELLAKLLDLARVELSGKALSKEDADWIKGFAYRLDSATVGADSDSLLTTLVADIFTDANTRQVVQVATGNLAVLAVASPNPDGTFDVAAGPAFTTYEFKHPAADRLTDEAWREMLEKGKGQPDLLADWARPLYVGDE
jgi:hypothetical protein